MSHIKNENSIAKQNISRKYMSLKEIEDAITNPNFGENIEINTGYCVCLGHNLYQGESLSKSLDYNYNLRPPLYTVHVPPLVYNCSVNHVRADCRANNTGSIETPFLKTKKGVSIKKGSKVLIKKTYNQYKICINHKGTVKKIFKIDNGNWYFFVEIENEEIRKQIIEIHHYLEKNNNKKFKYPFYKDINQEKSWIVIPNKTENFELIEYNNESIVTSTSTNTSSTASHFANVNANILASAATFAHLKADSDAFWDVFNTSLASPASKKQKI